MTPSPALPVVLPLLMAAFLAGLRRWLRRWIVDSLAVATAAANLAMSLLLLEACWTRNIVYWFAGWFPRGRMALGIGFEVDPVGAGLAALASLLMLLALFYSSHAMDSGRNFYHPLMLIFLAAMCGFAMTADLFNLFVFFELMSIAAFALCGLKTKEPAPLQGSFNFAITNTVGAFFILTGIALIYAATGALNMAQIGWLLGSRHDSLVTVAAAFLISGFLVKAAASPFHFWLPDAHSVAPTPVCALFSGLMVELGAFAVLRLASVLFGQSMLAPHAALRWTVLVVASLTAIWGGLMCFAEHHIKRILAFSTVSHAGAMLVGVALASPAAVAGWMLYVFAHAMAKASLFFTAGIMLQRMRSMSEPALFTRGRPYRVTAGVWLLGGIALAALPPFGLASGEDLIEQTCHAHALSLWVSFLFFFIGTMTAATVFRVFLRVFLGLGDRGPSDRGSIVDERPENTRENPEPPPNVLIAPPICLALATLPFFIPHAARYCFAAAARFLSQPLYIHRIYAQPFTLPLPAAPHPHLASELIHGGAAVSCAALLACAAVFRKRLPRPLRLMTRLEGRFFPLRVLQSGHPGDYVVWCMVGFVLVGSCLFLLR